MQVERPVGAFEVGSLRGTLVAEASSRPLGVLRGGSRSRIELSRPSVAWRVDVRLDLALPGARGTQGVLYRCLFETRTLRAADVLAALPRLRARVAVDGRRAAVGVAAERWDLPCASPAGRFRGVYHIGSSGLAGGTLVAASSPEAALQALPDGVGWLREALRGDTASLDRAPVPPPVSPGEILPAWFPAGTGYALAALVVAAKEGEALDDALAYTLAGRTTEVHPPSHARLLERLRAGSPPSLRAVVLRTLVPRADAPRDSGDAAWGERVGDALPDPVGALPSLDAALAACVQPGLADRCLPWRVAAMRAIAVRSGDSARLAAVAALAWRLPRAWSLEVPRAEARVEALRVARSLPDPAVAVRAATAMLGGSDADPMLAAEGDGPRGRLLEEQSEAKWPAARVLVGRCDAATTAAATAGLRAVPYQSRLAAACVLRRCQPAEAVQRAVDLAAPNNPLNRAVLARLPGWCAAPDASTPPP